MNNKGFTLVELLATIMILALIAGISMISYSGYLNRSKDKTEEIFKKNISDYIDAFITSNTNNFSDNTLVGNNVYSQKYNNHIITFQDLIDSNIINAKDLKNNTNNKVCSTNTNITIYRDNNYVYCFIVYLNCLDSSDNEVSNCSSYIMDKIGG